MADSEPGQNMVAVGTPWRSALTQIGVPWSHQASSLLAILNTPGGIAGSSKVLFTMPWWSG